MKIISYNVNGIRAAIQKGFTAWLSQENPDVICLQELKSESDRLERLTMKELQEIQREIQRENQRENRCEHRDYFWSNRS